MAHPYKRIKLRVSRTIEQILELQGIGANQEENDTIDHCRGILQHAQAAVHTAIRAAEERAKPSRPRPAAARAAAPATPEPARAPAAAAPQYGPATGVSEARTPRPKSWTTREAMKPAGDDDEIMALPHDATPGEFVQQCLDGLRGIYDGQAARKLAGDAAAWEAMDDTERMDAINALSLQMARDDPMDDIDETAKPAAAATTDDNTF